MCMVMQLLCDEFMRTYLLVIESEV